MLFPRIIDLIQRSGTEDAPRLVLELERRLRPRQLTLGDLIEQLTKIRDGARDREVPVRYVLGFAPGEFHSYRGYYDQIALGISGRAEFRTVNTLLASAQGAIGSEFTGWKGGEYTMTANTLVWIAESGSASGLRLVGVRDAGYQAFLDIMDEDAFQKAREG